MTPKEKAEELVDSMSNWIEGYGWKMSSKQCALIAVDEIIDTLNRDIRDLDVRGNVLLDLINYWGEVKNEIELL